MPPAQFHAVQLTTRSSITNEPVIATPTQSATSRLLKIGRELPRSAPLPAESPITAFVIDSSTVELSMRSAGLPPRPAWRIDALRIELPVAELGKRTPCQSPACGTVAPPLPLVSPPTASLCTDVRNAPWLASTMPSTVIERLSWNFRLTLDSVSVCPGGTRMFWQWNVPLVSGPICPS